MDKTLLGRASVAIQRGQNANWPRFSSAVIAEKDVKRALHAITSAGDAVQTLNKRAWNVLHPRLQAKLSRVTAGDYVLSTTVARVIAFDPRLNRVRTTCSTGGYPRSSRGKSFKQFKTFTASQSRANFFPRVSTCYPRLLRVLFTCC